MISYSFKFFTLSFILHSSHGFEVIQPQNQTVNPDGLASIRCEHTADVTSLVDVRLLGISLTGNPKQILLCQMGMKNCRNIILHEENPNKYLFILLNIGPETMNMKYVCEFTVKKDDLHLTKKGTPTTLVLGKKKVNLPAAPASCSPAPTPHSHLLKWIIIGLLSLMILYSCVITTIYIRQRIRNGGPENSTYVVMRKGPMPRNPPFDVYGS